MGVTPCYAFLTDSSGGDNALKVLIASRSSAITTLLPSFIARHEVHICHTGRDALVQLESLRPDVFILELMLPEMDGLTVLRTSQYKPAHILALTNLVTNDVIQTAIDAGVQDMILLPCSVHQIITYLDRLTETVPSPEL